MKKSSVIRQIDYYHNKQIYLVIIKRNKGRFLRLSVGKFNKTYQTYEITFTSPKKVSDAEVINLLDKHCEWLDKQLAKKSQMINLKEDEALLFGNIVSKDYYVASFEEALNYITERYNYLAKIAKVDGVSLTFRKMKSRWGSYNRNKKLITLNKSLVILPKDLIDYVICHELTHHFVFNHSKDFYNHFSLLYPNYYAARKAIKKYSDSI